MGAIEANRRYAGLLGWAPADFGVTGFDGELVAGIQAAQHRLDVEADGICGPTTYGAWLAERQASVAKEPANPTGPGLIAMYEAKRTWLRDVLDLPPVGSPRYEASRSLIDAMIRSADGLDWSWLERPYRQDFEWCGAFASYAWRAAGLARAWRYTYFASTFRLDCWGRYQAFQHTPNPRPAAGPYRQMLVLDEHAGPMDACFDEDDLPRAGDLLLVGGVNTAFGKHIAIVESYDPVAGIFTTIEGNATGAGPTGATRHGVVRTRRPVGLPKDARPTTYHARRLIRPAPTDLGET
jgi:hypothetical protein